MQTATVKQTYQTSERTLEWFRKTETQDATRKSTLTNTISTKLLD